MCAGLAPKVRVFNERRLDEAKFPFIMVDVTFIKSREGDRVVSKDVAEKAKLVLQAPDTAEAKRRLTEFIERFERLAPKAVTCLEEAFEDAMAVMTLPDKYRKRLRTTNMQERLNGEIKRRTNVIRIFPNDESALRLIGALLAETNEQWVTRRYLDMDEFNEWLAEQELTKKNVIEINKIAN